jgi:hypothetical protein
MPASITCLRLDANHDLVLGGSGLNLLVDIDAVAQIIQTRLLLFQGEWWENTNEGLALWQSILGVGGASRNLATINLLLQQRIELSPFVTGVQNVQSSFDPNTRQITYAAEVTTPFGTLTITNQPTPPDQSIET